MTHASTTESGEINSSSRPRGDIQTRLLLPLIIILCIITAVAGLGFYQSERSKLLQELDIRGQAMSASLSAYSSQLISADHRQPLETHLREFIEDKKLIHKVSIFRGDSEYLTVNRNQLREKIRPQTLRHYALPIYAADESVIGRVEISLSTQDIDDYLGARLVQIVIIAMLTVLLTIIFMAWQVRRVVIRPLERLTHRIQTISMGRLDQPVVSFSWDEIGHLFHDINAMRVRFKRRQDEMIDALINRKHFDPGAPHNASANALIIDDDELIRMQAGKLLEKQGITSMSADSGPNGLALLKSEDFDIVLLDLMMPEMTGYEVLAEIRKMDDHRHTPVIVISSIDDKTSIVRALRGGASDYVIKPFNRDELSARINILLNAALRDRQIDYLVEERISELKRQTADKANS